MHFPIRSLSCDSQRGVMVAVVGRFEDAELLDSERRKILLQAR